MSSEISRSWSGGDTQRWTFHVAKISLTTTRILLSRGLSLDSPFSWNKKNKKSSLFISLFFFLSLPLPFYSRRASLITFFLLFLFSDFVESRNLLFLSVISRFSYFFVSHAYSYSFQHFTFLSWSHPLSRSYPFSPLTSFSSDQFSSLIFFLRLRRFLSSPVLFGIFSHRGPSASLNEDARRDQTRLRLRLMR